MSSERLRYTIVPSPDGLTDTLAAVLGMNLHHDKGLEPLSDDVVDRRADLVIVLNSSRQDWDAVKQLLKKLEARAVLIIEVLREGMEQIIADVGIKMSRISGADGLKPFLNAIEQLKKELQPDVTA